MMCVCCWDACQINCSAESQISDHEWRVDNLILIPRCHHDVISLSHLRTGFILLGKRLNRVKDQLVIITICPT